MQRLTQQRVAVELARGRRQLMERLASRDAPAGPFRRKTVRTVRALLPWWDNDEEPHAIPEDGAQSRNAHLLLRENDGSNRFLLRGDSTYVQGPGASLRWYDFRKADGSYEGRCHRAQDDAATRSKLAAVHGWKRRRLPPLRPHRGPI